MESTKRVAAIAARAGVISPFKFLLALVMAAMIGGCGGGDVADTPESVSSALRVQAQALVAVSPADAANQLMDFAERTFPQFFPGHLVSQAAGPFLYRQYIAPSGSTFLVVIVGDTPGFQLNGIYVLGGIFGNAPLFIGKVSDFPIPQTAPATGILTVTVSGTNFDPQSFTIGSFPLPASQGDFCSALPTDTTFSQIGLQFGGTLTITNCSFSANTGTIGVNLSIPQVSFPVALTITYAFH